MRISPWSVPMFAKRFADLRPYVPGEQPVDRDYVKLNANENPYPPSPGVTAALQSFDPAKLRLYPDPDSNVLRDAIAGMNGAGVTRDMIFTGNGSDEVLSFVFYAFFDSGFPLLFPEHTYSFYPVYAGYYGIPFKKIPLRKDFTVDVDAFLAEKSSGVIFANPNAPTGIFLPVAEIRTLLDRYPRVNLVIIRTFSKSFCFAGARLGYVIANPGLIRALFTTKNSFNHFPVDAVTQAIGTAACRDREYYRSLCATIAKTRDGFASALRASGWEVLPSMTNFVFTRKKGLEGRAVYEALKANGILVRHFNIPGITDFVRISIGTPEDMLRLAGIMKGV